MKCFQYLFDSVLFSGYSHSSYASYGWLNKEDTEPHLYLSISDQFSWKLLCAWIQQNSCSSEQYLTSVTTVQVEKA